MARQRKELRLDMNLSVVYEGLFSKQQNFICKINTWQSVPPVFHFRSIYGNHMGNVNTFGNDQRSF